MKKVILSLFFFLLWSGCKDSDNPLSPVIPEPTITGFSPTSGAVGTSVTITGTNFSPTVSDNIVKVNNTTASVTAATVSSLTVTIPAGASTGKITVQVGNQVCYLRR